MEIGVRDAAEMLHVSEKTLYRWISAKKIPYSMVGSQYRFSRSGLDEWVRSRSVAGHSGSDASKEPASALSLRLAVESGGIAYRVEGHDVRSVLQNSLRLARLPDHADRDLLLRLLLEREALCSSGMGNGVALPHPRQPVMTELPYPLIALHFPEHPIDFDAVDGRLVHAFFLILSPSVELHLQFLSRLCFVLQQDDFLALLEGQASRQSILAMLDQYDQKLWKDISKNAAHSLTDAETLTSAEGLLPASSPEPM